ncbi:hypothetical protein MOD25_05485 [Bacillus haynesii]|uniref:hypothetical protein n=1 Tax=Bacillus haynesii TaxID=1925021 RepID=UPI00227DE257|nr:hypothetical protein [Bacillus haynesii]MCY8549353.1 hypothetical protein [Bacillus haynesii]
MKIDKETKEKILELYRSAEVSDNKFGIQFGIEEMLDILGIEVDEIKNYYK